MQEKSRIEVVKEYFETCPYLDKNSKLGIDFLDLGRIFNRKYTSHSNN